MSDTDERVDLFKERHQELCKDVLKQGKECDELSRQLDILTTTKQQLTDKHTKDTNDKWKGLLHFMVQHEAKFYKKQGQSKLRKMFLNWKDKATPSLLKDLLPTSDLLESLSNTRKAAESLRYQANALELSANKLFGDSTQTEEMMKTFDEDIQDYIDKVGREVVQLETSERSDSQQVERNAMHLDAATVKRDKAQTSFSRSQKVHDITKKVPGTNIFTYLPTKIMTGHHASKVLVSIQEISDLEGKRDYLIKSLQTRRARIEELRGSRQRLQDVIKASSTNSIRAKETTEGARYLGQRCENTASGAYGIIQAINLEGIRLGGAVSTVYWLGRGKILDALELHIQHLDLMGVDSSSPVIQSAMHDLRRGLHDLKTSGFVELYRQQCPQSIEMGEL